MYDIITLKGAMSYGNYFFQTAMKDREKHKIALSAYKKHVKEIEDWYDEMKVRQATTPQATDSVAELQKQLTENKVGYRRGKPQLHRPLTV